MDDNFVYFDDYLKMSGKDDQPAPKPVKEDNIDDVDDFKGVSGFEQYRSHEQHHHHHHHHSDENSGSEHHHSHSHHHSHEHHDSQKRVSPDKYETISEEYDNQLDVHEHEHSEDSKNYKYMLLGGIAAFIIGMILKFTALPAFLSAILLIAATVLAGIPIFIKGGKNFLKGPIDENVLMTIAIAAALLLGEFAEAAAVALFYRLGEMMEDFASNRSRESIRSLSEIQSDTANIISVTGDVKTVDAGTVEAGSKIIIYPHERIPLDCEITEGVSNIDASAITGESLPVPVEKGSVILSGSVNGSETLKARTVNTLEESAASKIIRMVEEASAKKSKSQKLISKIAAYYTPAVMLLALLVALIPSLITHDWGTWTHRALVLLVISCPCALVLSVPLGFFTSLGTAARKGILVKGSRFIEDTAAAQCVVFDKTGTLTEEKLSIGSVTSPVGLAKEAVILLAAIAEHRSTHPIAMAIKASAPEVPENLISNITEIAGYGASADFCGRTILCGNKKMFEEKNIKTGDEDGVFVAINNRLAGIIKINAEIRNDASDTINELRESGIQKIVMLTGDSYEAAESVSYELGVDEFYADMRPGEKLDKVRELQQAYGKVIYVGDGINDAPVLAAADVGVGMGLGSAAALESADVVLTNSNISKLSDARKLSERTMNIFKKNVTFILAVKVIVMLLGIIGVAPMWLAVFSDVGVCFISVIISSLIASDDIKTVLTSLLSDIKKAFKK